MTSDPHDFLNRKALEIHRRLIDEYGEPQWHPGRDPVASLVSTIISQNTNDTNRDVAYERLRERFPTWEQVRDAPMDELIEAIRPAGLAPTKGPRIQEALRAITRERGEITLDFLAELPPDQAKAWLSRLNGVGPKTAAIVLLFALGMPAFPVDTHIHRVSQRLGLIGPKTSREQAHTILEKMMPPETFYAFHLNLIAHGRRICHARRPRCGVCLLQDLCDYYSRSGQL
ncbi:MAG: endonuclease III [Anaerolineae bacterium]|jgi:endonuclease-3|nr:endonuclease III [Anaerolineae bacterium]MDH7475015.1 endonuclease III [Anaerolineae bacterium]